MNRIGLGIAQLWQAETALLISAFSVAGLLLIFGVVADEVMGGSTSGLDRFVILLFRDANDPSILIGPIWVPEMVRYQRSRKLRCAWHRVVGYSGLFASGSYAGGRTSDSCCGSRCCGAE